MKSKFLGAEQGISSPSAGADGDDRMTSGVRAAERLASNVKTGGLADALEAWAQIRSACLQAQRDQEWHRKAVFAASRRELRYRQVLVALTTALGLEDGASAHAQAAPVREYAAQVSLPDRGSGTEDERGWTHRHAANDNNPMSGNGPAPRRSCDGPNDETEFRHPGLTVYMLRPFSVFKHDRPVTAWTSQRSKSLFKYLVLNRRQPVAREVLWHLFWPDASEDTARKNLNVAMCGLRKSLAQTDSVIPHVCYEDGRYRLREDIGIWVDVEEFDRHAERGVALAAAGERAAAAAQFRVSAALYQSDLLDEDRYADWAQPVRQSYRDRHRDLLQRLSALYFDEGDYDACISIGNRLLLVEPCDEETHRMLMRCHARMEQAHLALRQFHICVGALSEHLSIAPSIQSVELFRQIKLRQAV
jgi:DNA-binding SARP family transcriptional activator